jgi:hypothetical protein
MSERTTTNDPKTTIGISIRMSLIERIRDRAESKDVNFSWMCAYLLGEGLKATPQKSKEFSNGKRNLSRRHG